MKINYFALKNYYALHILAFSGWMNLIIYNLLLPLNKNNCHSGIDYILTLLLGCALFTIFLSFLVYLFEWFFHTKVKNSFLLKNRIYDYFFDIGIICAFLPIAWLFTLCRFNIFPFIILILFFTTLRILKSRQHRD